MPWPIEMIFLIEAIVITVLILLAIRSTTKFKHWRAAHPLPVYPPSMIEEICRVMASIDGRNPDDAASRTRYTDGRGKAKYMWELYRERAMMAIAANEIINKYKEASLSDGK